MTQAITPYSRASFAAFQSMSSIGNLLADKVYSLTKSAKMNKEAMPVTREGI